MSSDRKALLRGGSDGPGMRNLPLFVFLAGLVFFFYLFYLHQSQSAEYAIAQSALEDYKQQLRALKLDLLNAKADNERLRASESSLKDEKDKLKKEKDKCSVSLRNVERQRDSLKKEISEKNEENKRTNELLERTQQEILEYRKVIATYNSRVSHDYHQSETESKPAITKGNANEAGGRLDASAQVSSDRNKEKAKEADIQYENEIANEAVKNVAARELQQAPAPVAVNVEGDRKEALKSSLDAAPQKKDDTPAQVGQPPQQSDVRQELAAAAVNDQQSQEHVGDKPVVRGGDYADKLDVEKGIGDDVQPA